MGVVRDDTGEHLVMHSSFLVASSSPSDSLSTITKRIITELEEEDDAAENLASETPRTVGVGTENRSQGRRRTMSSG